MNNTKKITVIGLYVAILLGSQFALSTISGVELITALLLCFCCVFGVIMGVTVATVFSVARCLLFGFYPSIILLYLIYYNAFALFFGSVGKKLTESFSLLKFVLIVISAVLFTACFTLLDDVITPLFYGLDSESALAYFYSSFSFMLPQLVCTFASVSVLYIPVTKLYKKVLQ